jgi:antitoxin (DNA-binding transcriptional repressor) of toxin-antitoxin stability system
MKFITVRDFRTSPAQIWKQLPKEQELIVTNNGKPIALLTPLRGENLEETVRSFRRARAISSVNKMQEISLQLGNSQLSEEEIEAEIQKSRNGEK